jgi:hypothetical protein
MDELCCLQYNELSYFAVNLFRTLHIDYHLGPRVFV